MKVLNVQNLIDTQAQINQARNLSQFTRFQESSPTFVTYYSISNPESTVEIGSRQLMEYVGNNSPVRYKEIKNFPMYHVDVINSSIEYDETLGTSTEYESECLILNSVLLPLPGDHFTIPVFSPDVIFVVTDVAVRAIKGEDHYVTKYAVVPSSRLAKIKNQVVEHYESMFRNIGTEDKVLIRRDDWNLLNECTDSYKNILVRYLDENYDAEIGYLRTPENLSGRLFGMGTCKYLIKFMMDNRIGYFDEALELIFSFEMPLPFEPKHNRIYNRFFFLSRMVTKKLERNKNVFAKFKSLPVSLFRDVMDINLYQTVEFLYQEDDTSLDETWMKIMDKDLVNQILDKDYNNLTGLHKVMAKGYHNEDVTVDEYNSIIDDYDATDMDRFYFIPYTLLMLKLKIKGLTQI